MYADNDKNEAVHLATKKRAEANTYKYRDKTLVIRGFSHIVAKDFTPKYFDWLYIDALHTYGKYTRNPQLDQSSAGILLGRL